MSLAKDTDPRILVAELALPVISKYIFSKSNVRAGLRRDGTNAVLSRIESQIMTLKFSYLAPAEMAKSDTTASMREDAKSIYLAYRERIEKGMPEMARASLYWAFRIFSGMARRFRLKGEKPSCGIDLVAVQIRNIARSGKLYRTRCMAGPMEMTIMTNMEGLKTGDTLGAAFLPPAVVGGIVSEAMFLGSEPLTVEPGTFLDPSGINTKEADGILVSEFARKK